MRKKLLLVFICVLFMAFGMTTPANTTKNLSAEEVLGRCFTSSKAHVVESTLSCWTRLNDRYLTKSQLTAEMSRLLEQIKPDKGTVSRTVQQDGAALKEMAYASKGNKSYTIAVESIKSGSKGETYAIIDVSIDSSYAGLAAEGQSLRMLFGDKAQVKLSSCIIGTIDGKLTQQQMKEKTSTAFKAVSAKRVEGMELDGMTSISGFTRDIESYIMSDNQKVNVQIALRYSSYDDKTYIWIGSPIIPVEY